MDKKWWFVISCDPRGKYIICPIDKDDPINKDDS